MARISEKTIDKIYEVPLTEAIGKIYNDTSYKINGNIAKGNSPFNSERTSSFSVINSKGIWKDFSSGKGGNNFISFVMEYKKVDYPEAVKICAEALHINIEYEEETEVAKQKREEKQTALQLLDKTSKLFQQNFQQASSENWWKQYMLERGFTEETLQSFQIGYALHGQLYEIFKEQGVVTLAEEVSLLNKDTSGNYYPVFRDRIMFPICDLRGHCVGFGGRVNPQYVQKCESEGKKAPAKYLNSAENPYFNKSKLLYGLHLARKSMLDTKEVYLVEGYTDVMRMHQIGLLQTVAPMGTALTDEQISIIKKHCNKVILFRDFDPAGQQAAFRDMQLLLKAGLFVQLVVPTGNNVKEDPDSIGLRKDALDFIQSARKDALIHIIEKEYNEAVNKSIETYGKKKKVTLIPEDKKSLTTLAKELISIIPDETVREIYQETIQYLFGLKIPIEKPKKEAKKTIVNPTNVDTDKQHQYLIEAYDLPDDVAENIDVYAEDIMKYGVFQHKNQIFVLVDKEQVFKSISNFYIEIIQHIRDEKYPLKLIRLRNIFGKESVFDINSEKLNTLQTFKNMVSNCGNYYFSGNPAQLEKLLKMLFDKMKIGRKIEVLGWQKEGFWVWNNRVIFPEKEDVTIDDDGLFQYKGESFYVPSANIIYKNNDKKFKSQKDFKCIEGTATIENYFSQMYKVHRGHAITGMLFAIASMYQDFIVDKLNGFPLLFYFGGASSGKDNLSLAIQSMMFDRKQESISLGSDVSTAKAKIRDMSAFSNGITLLSEYRRGNSKIDETIKGLWDRRGYKRGSIESDIATDSVPIRASTIFTSNEYPNDEAIITRCLWEEMDKTKFTIEEGREYDKFSDMIEMGATHLTNIFIHKRNYFEKNFLDTYRRIREAIAQIDGFQDTKARMLMNYSILITIYELFEKEIFFPFGKQDMMEHFKKALNNQKRKIASESPTNKFWDCFLMCMKHRQGNEAIRVDENFREEGGSLFFNFTTIYGMVQQHWFTQYREAAPSKSDMKKQLKESLEYVNEIRSMRINAKANPTSVLQIDINKLPIAEEIFSQISLQRYSNNGENIFNDDENTIF
ncbi:DNA primase [Capnocytophaga canimorsus]|uniref:DNA primase n=1 Tax=Capnocytophaga canimorsus TaxID=28188 RepID=UPI0037D13F81